MKALGFDVGIDSKRKAAVNRFLKKEYKQGPITKEEWQRWASAATNPEDLAYVVNGQRKTAKDE